MKPIHYNGRTDYTVYDSATGEVLRSGYCSLRDLHLQARAGQAVLAGVKGRDIEDRVIIPINGAKPYLYRRSASDVAKRRPPESVDPLAILIEALKAKGIEVSAGDLAAAAKGLQARRAVDAGG